MEALILDVPNKTARVKNIPIPEHAPDQLLIKVHAVALNPVDAYFTANPLAPSTQVRVVGSDFAGTVSRSGSSVPREANLPEGCRVAGFLQGACSVNERPGAFAEYLVVDWDLVWKIPDGMSLESAATVSLCALTAAQGLFPRLGIKAPFEWNDEVYRPAECNAPLRVFIYGASTSLGLYTAQLVRLAAKANGKEAFLYGAASPARHEMLKAAPYSYNGLVDYREPDWPEKFLESNSQARVEYAVDCISEGPSVKNAIKTVSPTGNMAIFQSRASGAWTAEEGELPFEPIYGAVWQGLGVEIQFRSKSLQEPSWSSPVNSLDAIIPASPRAREFTVAFYDFLSNTTTTGLELQPNQARIMPGGLENIVNDGFAVLGGGPANNRRNERKEEHMIPISAEKLVYKLV